MRNRNPERNIRAGHGGGTGYVRDKYDRTGYPPIEFSLSDYNFLLANVDEYVADGDGAVLLWSPR